MASSLPNAHMNLLIVTPGEDELFEFILLSKILYTEYDPKLIEGVVSYGGNAGISWARQRNLLDHTVQDAKPLYCPQYGNAWFDVWIGAVARTLCTHALILRDLKHYDPRVDIISSTVAAFNRDVYTHYLNG